VIALVTGAGGFIGGHLVGRLIDEGYSVLAVDRKERARWYQLHERAANLVLDLRDEKVSQSAIRGIDEVYHLAADMGGIGFIERNRVSCMRSVLMTLHLLESSAVAGVKKFFFSSSACVYPSSLQSTSETIHLAESDAYPAQAERGYGWEKLYGEMLCEEYAAERGLATSVARFHNIFGPHGTWRGGREKAPAAIARKVATARVVGLSEIDVWGDGRQRRTYTYIADCIEGIRRIVSEESLVATPINLGSTEVLTVDELIDAVEAVDADLFGALPSLLRRYDETAPRGVASRAPDNTLIRERLGWEPSTTFRDGMEETYRWIYGEAKRATEERREFLEGEE
jgi:nucleoside-diphosphate-sugar epimerase